MNSKDYNRITPGKIIVVWRIIKKINENDEFSNVQDLTSILNESGLFGGTVPVKESILLGQTCDLFYINKGYLYLSDYSISELLPVCDDIEPNQAVIRELLYKIITTNRLHWILFFNDDVEIFKTAIPNEWIELLEGMDLFEFGDQEAINWWKKLLESFHEFDEKKKKEIGDVGEKLTIEFEKSRMINEGVEQPHKYIKWMSKFSNSFGYDIESIRGKLLEKGDGKYEKIKLEVKSSALAYETNFIFYVSRNEWNIALSDIDTYYFYMWLGVDVLKETASKGPYIVSARQLEQYFPEEKIGPVTWHECKVVLDLKEYAL